MQISSLYIDARFKSGTILPTIESVSPDAYTESGKGCLKYTTYKRFESTVYDYSIPHRRSYKSSAMDDFENAVIRGIGDEFECEIGENRGRKIRFVL